VTQMIDIDLIFRILLFPGFTFILILKLFFDWVERKFEARIQNRVGPLVAGPAGLFQPLVDFIKLLTKEDIEPPNCGTTDVGISAGDVK